MIRVSTDTLKRVGGAYPLLSSAHHHDEINRTNNNDKKAKTLSQKPVCVIMESLKRKHKRAKMNLAKAKEYYELSLINRVGLVRDPISGGWMVVFSDEEKGKGWELRTARGDVRLFKTLDAAISTVEEISGRVSSFGINLA